MGLPLAFGSTRCSHVIRLVLVLMQVQQQVARRQDTHKNITVYTCGAYTCVRTVRTPHGLYRKQGIALKPFAM